MIERNSLREMVAIVVTEKTALPHPTDRHFAILHSFEDEGSNRPPIYRQTTTIMNTKLQLKYTAFALASLASCSTTIDDSKDDQRHDTESAINELIQSTGDTNDNGTLTLWVSDPTVSFHPAQFPPTHMKQSIDAGGTVHTFIDEVLTDEISLETKANEERLFINQHLLAQFSDYENKIRSTISRLGLDKNASDVGHSGFTLHIRNEDAPHAVEALEREGYHVRPPEEIATNIVLPFADAMGAVTINSHAHPYGMNGDGVGIWFNEPYPPNLQHPMFDATKVVRLSGTMRQPTGNGGTCTNNVECCSGMCSSGTCNASPTCLNFDGCNGNPANCTGTPRPTEHATACGLVLQRTTPKAKIYHEVNTGPNCFLSSNFLSQTNPPVYAGSMSFGWANPIGEYTYCDGQWDSFIESSKIAMFHATGNSMQHTASPGVAYNVSSVGRSAPQHSAQPDFGWLRPDTGAAKPEMVAPGQELEWGTPGSHIASGSSFATPIAAGFAANMMTLSAYFRNSPQTVRATMIASAHYPNSNYRVPQIDYASAWFNRGGENWSNGTESSWFDSNSKIIRSITLTPGSRYRIAISWLAKPHPGTYMINQSIALRLQRGTTVYDAWDVNSNYQMIDLVVPAGGSTWTLTMHRRWYLSGAVNMALTIGEIVS